MKKHTIHFRDQKFERPALRAMEFQTFNRCSVILFLFKNNPSHRINICKWFFSPCIKNTRYSSPLNRQTLPLLIPLSPSFTFTLCQGCRLPSVHIPCTNIHQLQIRRCSILIGNWCNLRQSKVWGSSRSTAKASVASWPMIAGIDRLHNVKCRDEELPVQDLKSLWRIGKLRWKRIAWMCNEWDSA